MRKLEAENAPAEVALCDIALAALDLDRMDGLDVTVDDIVAKAVEFAAARHARSQ